MIDLFCAKEGLQPILNDLFNHGEFTYACDGSIAVRIPKTNEHADGATPGKYLADTFLKSRELKTYVSLNDYEIPKVSICKFCTDGTPQCPECNGSGAVGWSTTRHSYEADCKQCHGDGYLKCPECKGEPQHNPDVMIENTVFSAKYLNMIKDLPPEVRFFVNTEGAAYFTFDGGEGVVMPKRSK